MWYRAMSWEGKTRGKDQIWKIIGGVPGQDATVGRKVAIKLLVDRSEGGGDNNVNPSHKEFLRYEACLTSQLHHPNITALRSPSNPVDGGGPADIVMEYMAFS